MDYDVFISCKSEDYKKAERIYEFLKKNDIHTFLASRELRNLGDSEYRRAITNALKSAYHILVFASKAEYVSSTWVFYEWDMFINAKLKGFKHGQVITILDNVKVDDISMDLWKYESFTYNDFQEKLLDYVQTPASLQRKKEAEAKEQEKRRLLQMKEEEEKRKREAEVQKERTIQQIKDSSDDYKRLSVQQGIIRKELIEKNALIGHTDKDCPVCHKTLDLDAAWCPRCGYILPALYSLNGIFNGPIDDALLKEHFSFYRTIWQGFTSLSKEKEAIQAFREELESISKEKDVKMLSLQQERDSLMSENQAFIEQNQHLINDLSKVRSDYGTLLQSKNTLEQRLKELLQDNHKLEQRNPSVKASTFFKKVPNVYLTGDMTYMVYLHNCGPAKLQVIKAIKELLDVGLGEAKTISDKAPIALAEFQDYNYASRMKEELTDAGAVVEIKSGKGGQIVQPSSGSKYQIVLIDAGQAKLAVIKRFKELFNLELREAKELVDKAPVIIHPSASESEMKPIIMGMLELNAKFAINPL